MTELKVLGGSRSHDTLRRILSQRSPGKVLDCPAGTGVLSQFLQDLGWDVHCADIDAGNFEAEGFPFEEVNLNQGIPYEDESFDAVLCANGLHRLYHPASAIKEFYRVLRPGGSLYVNINNYASIQKRLRFLFYGSITNTINESNYKQTSTDPQANVRHHLFYPQLANHLEETGFRIAEVRAASVKMSHRLLWPFALLIQLAAYLVSPASRKRNRIASTNSPGILPGGKYLYVEAVKPTS